MKKFQLTTSFESPISADQRAFYFYVAVEGIECNDIALICRNEEELDENVVEYDMSVSTHTRKCKIIGINAPEDRYAPDVENELCRLIAQHVLDNLEEITLRDGNDNIEFRIFPSDE